MWSSVRDLLHIPLYVHLILFIRDLWRGAYVKGVASGGGGGGGGRYGRRMDMIDLV